MSQPLIGDVEQGDIVTIDVAEFEFGETSTVVFNRWLAEWREEGKAPSPDYIISMPYEDSSGYRKFPSSRIYSALVAQQLAEQEE